MCGKASHMKRVTLGFRPHSASTLKAGSSTTFFWIVPHFQYFDRYSLSSASLRALTRFGKSWLGRRSNLDKRGASPGRGCGTTSVCDMRRNLMLASGKSLPMFFGTNPT